MNSVNIIGISVFLLIQLIVAKPQYGTYNAYGTYPYYSNTQPVLYNPVPGGVQQNLAPTFSNLGGTTPNPLYSALGFNTNTNYAANNGYYNNGYATNQANQASQANQIRIWPFVMGSTSYSNYGYNTPNWYSTNYSYK